MKRIQSEDIFMNLFLTPKILTGALFILSMTSIAFGQETILEKVERSLPSIVGISAQAIGLISMMPPTAASYERSGAGVIVDKKGRIITNAHIVAQAQEVEVTFYDGTKQPATVVGFALEHDVAILLLSSPVAVRPIPWGDSDQVKLGDEIITVGHSEFLKQTVSGGKVTGLGTSLQDKDAGLDTTALIRISINVYQGDSGGPLLDRQGRLIGLIAAKQMDVDRASFAIPVNKIKQHYLDYLSEIKTP